MTLVVKRHISHEGRTIVAVCDKGLLGKRFEEGNKQLDLTSTFYQGEEMNEEELLKLLKHTYLLNLVGEEAFVFAVKDKLLKSIHVIRVANIPYAEILLRPLGQT